MLPANHQRTDDASVVDSALRVFEAGQRVVLDRLDLARLDLAELISRSLRGAALIAAGALFVAGAWLAALACVAVWLTAYMSLVASLAVVGLVSGGVGAAAIAVGIQRAAGAAMLQPATDGPTEERAGP